LLGVLLPHSPWSYHFCLSISYGPYS
jgi:hypothetical protein